MSYLQSGFTITKLDETAIPIKVSTSLICTSKKPFQETKCFNPLNITKINLVLLTYENFYIT